MRYSFNDFTWGFELEVGDVQRSLQIPTDLGSWEYSERDIVNQRPPYRFIAADPLGKSPPVGGEINVYPTHTIEEQLSKISDLLNLFSRSGCPATISQSIMEAHVHIGIQGLMNDIQALKRLTSYILANQKTVVERCVAYKEHPLMAQTKTAKTYLKWDMGRMMPSWMGANLIKLANSFDDFIRIQCCGKDGMSRGRPYRYTVNTYCLKHTGTIEFRCFRASLDLNLIKNCFLFVRDFMFSALNGGISAIEIINKSKYKFPPFRYNHEEYLGWESSKWGEGRGKKNRTRIEI